MAMQQGGLGLVMSTLIVMTPPMAASFFQGALGNFVAQSSFGQIGRNSTGQGYDAGQQNGQRPDGNSLAREVGGANNSANNGTSGSIQGPNSGARVTSSSATGIDGG